MIEISENGKRAMIFLGIWTGMAQTDVLNMPEGDQKSGQLKAFARLAGISEYEALAAFAELEDKHMIQAPDA